MQDREGKKREITMVTVQQAYYEFIFRAHFCRLDDEEALWRRELATRSRESATPYERE